MKCGPQSSDVGKPLARLLWAIGQRAWCGSGLYRPVGGGDEHGADGGGAAAVEVFRGFAVNNSERFRADAEVEIEMLQAELGGTGAVVAGVLPPAPEGFTDDPR